MQCSKSQPCLKSWPIPISYFKLELKKWWILLPLLTLKKFVSRRTRPLYIVKICGMLFSLRKKSKVSQGRLPNGLKIELHDLWLIWLIWFMNHSCFASTTAFDWFFAFQRSPLKRRSGHKFLRTIAAIGFHWSAIET